MSANPNVGIIGGGLVGALCACYMSNRNYEVTLYEKRDDIREVVTEPGKSINLALSNRGIKALRGVGLEQEVLKNAVPMKGRLLHDIKGNTKFVPYDVVGRQCLYSISRNTLNTILLNAASSKSNVKLHFNHELVAANFQSGMIRVKSEKCEAKSVKFDLIIGADGAHSTLRKEMEVENLFSFSQKYIEHGYVELQIGPSKGDQMIPNCLHIWPRGEFMLIALPNWDSSWTVTLFMPFKKFESLVNPDDALNFFRFTFPDSVPLLGEEQLMKTLPQLKPRSLISISCSPYYVGDKSLLIGDAAHAMVPFYGQGMNAGFEDCSILNDILNRNDDNFAVSIREFSATRITDGHAICKLAMYNYMEMRDLVTKDSYYIRKKLDEFLYWLFPKMWIPLYISVTFTNIGYNTCLKNRKWQDKILGIIIFVVIPALIIIGTLLGKVLLRQEQD